MCCVRMVHSVVGCLYKGPISSHGSCREMQCFVAFLTSWWDVSLVCWWWRYVNEPVVLPAVYTRGTHSDMLCAMLG